MCECSNGIVCFYHRRMMEETKRRLPKEQKPNKTKVPVIAVSQKVWDSWRRVLFGNNSK